ncbi:hypothetical protein Hdeb2414_s0018g00519201 [Helianthus debilis subsp. tardiflorus]
MVIGAWSLIFVSYTIFGVLNFILEPEFTIFHLPIQPSSLQFESTPESLLSSIP